MKDLNLAEIKKLLKSLIRINERFDYDESTEDSDDHYLRQSHIASELGVYECEAVGINKFLHYESSFLRNVVRLIDILELASKDKEERDEF